MLQTSLAATGDPGYFDYKSQDMGWGAVPIAGCTEASCNVCATGTQQSPVILVRKDPDG